MRALHTLVRLLCFKTNRRNEGIRCPKQISDFLKLKGWIVFEHRNVGIYKQGTGTYIPLPYGEKGISDLIGFFTSNAPNWPVGEQPLGGSRRANNSNF